VFTPADGNQWGKGPLKDAINYCLSETPDGSCPAFAASNDATGNPYGVMGDWDVSHVTSMQESTSTPASRCLFRDGVTNLLFDLSPFLCLLLLASFLGIHLFVPIVFDVSGGG